MLNVSGRMVEKSMVQTVEHSVVRRWETMPNSKIWINRENTELSKPGSKGGVIRFPLMRLLCRQRQRAG